MPRRGRDAQPAKPPKSEPRKPAPASKPFELAGWAAPLVYAFATIILFREFILGPGLLFGQDTLALSYFARQFFSNFVAQTGTFPLWDPLLFGGIPFIDGMHGDIFYPPSLALFWMDPAQFWGWKMALHVFLAGVFTYLWLRELGLKRELALFGGLVFMMGSDLVSLVYPGGDGKLFVSALAPLAFLLTERAVSRRRVSDYAIFALGIALMVFTSHMQAVYFAIWGVTAYFFFRLYQIWKAEKQTSRTLTQAVMFGVAGIVGVGAAAVQFFPPLEYLRSYSHRAEQTNLADDTTAYRFASRYSMHAEEVVSLVVPDFVGDQAATETRPGDRYWGRNPLKLNNEFAGFIPLLLLPLLFMRRRSGQVWFFGALAILVIFYAVGANTPVFRLFYLIPGVKLFRAPSIIIFLYGLAIATLGALALERAIAWARGTTEERSSARKYLWIATGVFALLAMLAGSGAMISMWQGVREVANPQALDTNLPFITRGFALTFVIALLVALIWEGLARGIYGAGMVITLVCVLAFFESYRVDRPFIRSTVLLNEQYSAPLFVPDEAIQFLQQRKTAGEVFRVAELDPFLQQRLGGQSNTPAIHGLEQLGGHHGNEIGRYRTLIGGDAAVNALVSRFRLLDVTNTTYLTAHQLVSDSAFEEVHRGTSAVVYRRKSALPRAYLVGRTEVIAEDSTAMTRLLSPEFPYRTTAILPEALPAGVQIQSDPQGSVEWLERNVNDFRLRVRSDRPALLMVLDNYYPFWKATVDGQPVDVLRANMTFRALPVGAGEHEVAFRYDPENVRLPALVSALVLTVLLVLGFVLPLLQRLRGARPAEPQVT